MARLPADLEPAALANLGAGPGLAERIRKHLDISTAMCACVGVVSPVLLADEPAASLDPRYQLKMLDSLRHQADDGVAVIGVLQDLAQAARFADRVLVMQEGEIVADGVPEQVLTEGLLRSVFGVDAVTIERNGTTIVTPWSVVGGRSGRPGD